MESVTVDERGTMLDYTKGILGRSALVRNAVYGQLSQICMQGYFKSYTPLDNHLMRFRAPNGTLMFINPNVSINGFIDVIRNYILPDLKSFAQHVNALNSDATDEENLLRDDVAKEINKLNDILCDWDRIQTIISMNNESQEDEDGRGGETASRGVDKPDAQDN